MEACWCMCALFPDSFLINSRVRRLKHFSFDAMNVFRKEKLEPHFSNVQYIKPPASRSESSESYFVCRGWNPVREVPMYGILPESH